MQRRTPIHQCLLEVKSMGGAEHQPVIFNVTLCLMMVIGPGMIWWPVLTYIIHKFLQWVFQRDPHLSRIFFRYLREGDYYDPWPRANQKINKRPFGAGRDLPC